jgi:hypothetical protein
MALEIKQYKGAHSASGTVAVTLDSAVTAGSALIALCCSFTDTDYTIDSNIDGAFTLDTSRYQPASYVTTIWSHLACAAGSHTVTLSNGTTNSQLHVWEVAGVMATSALDQVQASTSGAPGNVFTLTPTAMTAQADELVIACVNATGPIFTPDTAGGYVGIATTDATYSRNFASEAKIVSSVGTYGPLFNTNINTTCEGIVATYKSAGGSLLIAGRLNRASSLGTGVR